MTPIGSGAVGDVYRLDSFTLPGVSALLAFKEIKGSVSQKDRDVAERSMLAAVAFRDALSDADKADLDEYTSWPVAIVEDQGAVVGLLMPLIPPDFFIPVSPPGGQRSSIVFELAFLAASDAYAAARGFDLSPANDELVRLALAAQLVYAVGRLHRHGIVYGDLSLRNAAVALNPPRIKLLDCDAAALATDVGRYQLHSPFFLPPENAAGGSQKLQDDKTDVYKLALCILRMLVRGRGTTQLKDPAYLQGILNRDGVELITRALSPDRAQRPTAREQFECLSEAIISRAQPPVMLTAEISRLTLLRGRDVIVSWKATGASRIRILGSNGLDVSIANPDSFPLGYSVTPLGSGEIVVEAENKHGADSLIAGEVDLFELPAFCFPSPLLPHPTVPNLPEVALPDVLLSFPPSPLVTVETHPVPTIEAPALAPAFEILQPPPVMLLSIAESLSLTAVDATADLRKSLLFDSTNTGSQMGKELEAAALLAAQSIQQLMNTMPAT